VHPSSSIEVTKADLALLDHQRAVVDLINSYAMDPMGNGGPLSTEVKDALIPGLRNHPTTMVFLAWEGKEAVGIAVCFLGFSTFTARPLVNIHDLAVLPAYRGKGIGRLLLAEVEREAHSLGCCKMTLEVLENNTRARKLYERAGFSQAVYAEAAGGALFMVKSLYPKR